MNGFGSRNGGVASATETASSSIAVFEGNCRGKVAVVYALLADLGRNDVGVLGRERRDL